MANLPEPISVYRFGSIKHAVPYTNDQVKMREY